MAKNETKIKIKVKVKATSVPQAMKKLAALRVEEQKGA